MATRKLLRIDDLSYIFRLVRAFPRRLHIPLRARSNWKGVRICDSSPSATPTLVAIPDNDDISTLVSDRSPSPWRLRPPNTFRARRQYVHAAGTAKLSRAVTVVRARNAGSVSARTSFSRPGDASVWSLTNDGGTDLIVSKLLPSNRIHSTWGIKL